MMRRGFQFEYRNPGDAAHIWRSYTRLNPYPTINEAYQDIWIRTNDAECAGRRIVCLWCMRSVMPLNPRLPGCPQCRPQVQESLAS